MHRDTSKRANSRVRRLDERHQDRRNPPLGLVRARAQRPSGPPSFLGYRPRHFQPSRWARGPLIVTHPAVELRHGLWLSPSGMGKDYSLRRASSPRKQYIAWHKCSISHLEHYACPRKRWKQSVCSFKPGNFTGLHGLSPVSKA